MKTIIILLACIACLVGCNPPMTSSDYIKNNYEVVVVDSCEYIFLNRNIEGFSHKGNCKYCRERLSHKHESAAYSLAVDRLGNIIDTPSGKIRLNRY